MVMPPASFSPLRLLWLLVVFLFHTNFRVSYSFQDRGLRFKYVYIQLFQSVEELKSFLMKVKEKIEKVGLKLNIQKTQITASGTIISWQIDEETMKTVTDFIFLGSKITADGDYSHEIKRCLLLGRKAMTNIDSVLKSRGITLPTKVHLIKAMIFPIVIYGCESWTIKKAEHWRIDAFELWYRRRLLRVPQTLRRSNQLILKKSVLNIHWKDWCRSWSSDTLATKCEESTHWKRPWCWERLKAGGEGDYRGQDCYVRLHHWLNGHEFEQAPGDSEGQGSLACCNPWGCKKSDTTEQLKNNSNIWL